MFVYHQERRATPSHHVDTFRVQLLWLVDLRERLEAAGGGAAPPPGAAVVACDFLPELGSLCLALSSGELLLLHPESSGSSGGAASGGPAVEVEEVGAVAGGLAAAAWSPDGELLLLVTAAAAMLLMTKDWEVLAEVPLLQHREQPLAASAAAAALAGGASGRSGDGGEAGAASEQQAEASLAPGSVCVSWRGDGRFFATASLDAPGQHWVSVLAPAAAQRTAGATQAAAAFFDYLVSCPACLRPLFLSVKLVWQCLLAPLLFCPPRLPPPSRRRRRCNAAHLGAGRRPSARHGGSCPRPAARRCLAAQRATPLRRRQRRAWPGCWLGGGRRRGGCRGRAGAQAPAAGAA
jgi:hypothetical protein